MSWHEHHDQAHRVLSACLEAADNLVLPAAVLVEAYAVMTRLPAPHRLAPAVARDLLAETFKGSVRLVQLDGRGLWSLLDGLAADNIAGGATYDAQRAACARRAGAATLVTFNARDFERLVGDELDVVVPR